MKRSAIAIFEDEIKGDKRSVQFCESKLDDLLARARVIPHGDNGSQTNDNNTNNSMNPTSASDNQGSRSGQAPKVGATFKMGHVSIVVLLDGWSFRGHYH